MVFIWCILLYIDAQILELGTSGTQIQVMVYICCNLLSMHIQILELGTVGTQI